MFIAEWNLASKILEDINVFPVKIQNKYVGII
jgi:hypothetical protein